VVVDRSHTCNIGCEPPALKTRRARFAQEDATDGRCR
jgi:hypothetical protein